MAREYTVHIGKGNDIRHPIAEKKMKTKMKWGVGKTGGTSLLNRKMPKETKEDKRYGRYLKKLYKTL